MDSAFGFILDIGKHCLYLIPIKINLAGVDYEDIRMVG